MAFVLPAVAAIGSAASAGVAAVGSVASTIGGALTGAGAAGSTAGAASGWATAAKVATIGSTALSVYGAYQQSKQQEAMQNYNAGLKETEAATNKAETRERIDRQRERNREFMRKQRASYAKAGIKTTGTPLAVMADSVSELELGVLDMNYQGQSRTTSLMQQSGLSRYGAQSTRRARPINTAANVLGGVNRLASMNL